jgi:hypothetical protein
MGRSTQRQFPVDVLDHHHRSVDDNAEIDGSNGEEIRRDIMCVQHDEGKQQRQRDRQGHDDCRAEADQKEDQHD